MPRVRRVRRDSSSILLILLILLMGCSGDDPASAPETEACAVTVSTPAAGDVYTSGEPVNIRWRAGGGADLVRVELLRDAGPVDVLADVTANDGYLPWSADGAMAGSGDDYAVQVTALGEDGCSGRSAAFTIHDTAGCSYAFTDVASNLTAGETTLLTWETRNGTGAVDIGLYRWTGQIGDVAVNLPDVGSYVWDVDTFNHGTDDHFWFEIRDHELPDCMGVSCDVKILDDDICTMLVTSPEDRAEWRVGQTRSIVFQQTNGNGRVNIILKAGQTFLGYIATDYDVAMGPLDWVVSNYGFEGPDTMYRIDVVDGEDEYCRAESGIFTILP